MRTPFKTVVIALALAFTVAASAFAAAGAWTEIPLQQVPTNVMTACRRLVANNKILKTEKSAPPTLYRFTIQHKGPGKPDVLIFDAKGELQR